MPKIAHFWRKLRSIKINNFHSYQKIITSKTLYSDPRVYLCKKGDDNRPNIPKIRRFAKPKLAIFGNFAKGLIMQKK